MNKKIEWFDCERHTTPERIALVSQEIGVTFPELFCCLMMECDAGSPLYTAFDYYDVYFKCVVGEGLGGFLGFEEGYCNLLKKYQSPPEFFPLGLIAFSQTGGGDLICFDYRQGKDNPDPEIVYWRSGSGEGQDISFIAKNFEAFMGMLKEDNDEELLAKLRAEKDL
jgi:hypothetical protein